MFELIKNLLFVGVSMYAITGLFYFNSAWKELAEKYGTEDNLPKTFLFTQNQRISFISESKIGSMSLTSIGIGVLEYGLYISKPGTFFLLGTFFPSALLIPWSDIAYRKIAATGYSNEY